MHAFGLPIGIKFREIIHVECPVGVSYIVGSGVEFCPRRRKVLDQLEMMAARGAKIGSFQMCSGDAGNFF